MIENKESEIFILDNLTDVEISKLFLTNHNVFIKHNHTNILFYTDGFFIYSIDDIGNDLFEDCIEDYKKYFHIIDYHYTDLNLFISTFKKIENLLNRELFLSDSFNKSECSIKEFQTLYKTLS